MQFTATNHYPFGMVMPGTDYTDPKYTGGYRYGFGGHENDDAVKGAGNHLAFGDMGYDPRTVRRFRTDPLFYLYVPISPYAFSLNSPILFTDADGNEVIGSDGRPVTYERDDNGIITWSENATDDIREVGNAMLATDFGEKAFNKWQNADTKITIKIDQETEEESGSYAETIPTKDEYGNRKTNADDQYEEALVVIYNKNLEKNRAENSGERFEGASREEALGAVATHEVYHNEKDQIKLDRRTPNELKQKSSKNLPINAEVNYRREYHKNNPGLENADWEKKYEERGYEGIEDQDEEDD